MATIDKTKAQTYNFLSENKSIEDIKQQPNIQVIKKSRHGGVTYKLIEINNTNNHQLNNDLFENIDENLKPTVTVSLTDNEKEQENNIDIVTKIKNFLTTSISNTEETSRLQSKIQELEKENQQLKNEKLKQTKQGSINFDNFKYTTITIYDEKQTTKIGINKIHEEILSIQDKLFFITTLVYNDGLIFEEIIYFDNNEKNEIEVWKQAKRYQNIEEYKKNTCLIDKKNQFLNKITIKDFLKQQQDFKLKPTKIERTLWCIFTSIAVLAGISTFIGVIILFFPTVAVIPAVALGLKFVGTLSSISFIRIFASLFSSATRKVDVWFGNKLYKNKDQKEKEKKERQSIIKNLTSNKLETKLQTQYDILKQELDNRKDIKPDKLINNNSNNLLENSNIESENNQDFDSSIRNIVNQQEQQTSTNLNHNWNKVKCLLTT